MKRVVVVNKSFFPAFKAGGPARSLTNLVRVMNEKVNFGVVTKDRDSGDTKSFPGIVPNRWCDVEGLCPVYYTDGLFINMPRLIGKGLSGERSEEIVFYFNSFFDPIYTTLPLIQVLIFYPKSQIIISPRGELSFGALSLKRLRKLFFIKMIRPLLVMYRSRVTYHFTSVLEYEEAKALPFINKFKICPNVAIPISAQDYVKRNKLPGCLRILFLSRISQKKQLHRAIEYVAEAARDFPGKFIFDVVGPIDDPDYFAVCRALFKDAPANLKVKFHGAVRHECVAEFYNNSHVFILPTLNENYGHAIVEAMKFGCIPIISEHTPWTHGMEEGVCVCFSGSEYVGNLKRIAAFDDAEFANVSRSVIEFINGRIQSDNLRTYSLFELD